MSTLAATAGASPAPEPDPALKHAPGLFAALRLGWQSTSMESCCFELSGSSPYVDAELGWRFDWWFTLAAFTGYGTMRGYAQTDAFPGPTSVFTHEHLNDFGVRAHFQVDIVLAGVGIGQEWAHASWRTRTQSFVEAHMGIVVPHLWHLAPELLVIGLYAPGGYDGPDPPTTSLRFTLGVELW